MSITQLGIRYTPRTATGMNTAAGARLEITNWNEVMKQLRDLDKDYIKELRKDFRRIAKEPQRLVKAAIPGRSQLPLSGMRQVHFGRLAWGSRFGAGAKPSKSVLIQTPNTRSRRYKKTDAPIVRLLVQSPATVLTDMAGRRQGMKGRKGLTPEYDYMYTIGGKKVPGKRRHRVVPGAFLKGLSQAKRMSQPRASRMVWPAMEKALPAAQRAMDLTISQVNVKISLALRSE